MGLLDSGPLSSPEAQIALAAGLLGGRGNFGANLGQGLLGAVATQQQERANRASDLQQLSGAYQMLKQQEFAKMLAAKQSGQPYFPNPMLPQMEQRIAQLTGLPNLSGQGPVSSVPQMPPQLRPQSQAPSMPAQGNPAPAAPAQGNPAPMPQADNSGLGGPAGGVPMEAWLAQDPTGATYLKQLAEDNKPIALRQGDLVGRGPGGTFRSLFQQPQMVPGVIPQRDGNGQVIAAHEVPGFSGAAANIKGAQTTATEAAKAPFTPIPVPGANRTVFMSQVSPYFQGGPNALQVPQTPNPQSLPQTGGVARVDVTEPSRQSQYGFQGSGLSGPDPVALAGATADAQAGAKARQDVMKKDFQTLADQSSSAQTVISRLQTIKQLGPQAITGAESEKRDFFNGLLSLVGVKGATDAKTAGDLVDKNAAQIALTIGAGSNGTDALRALAQIANPSRHMTLEAIQKASDSLVAPLQMTLAKTQLLTPHFSRGDTANYLSQKQAFEQGADPRIWELQNLPADQQQAYVSALSPQDAKELLQKRAILKRLGVIK